MRELTKSFFSYSLALSLFPLRQMQNLMTPAGRDGKKGPATEAFDALTNATTDQFGETLGSAFRMLDNVQQGIIGLMFSFLGFGSSKGRSDRGETAPPHGNSDIHWSSEPVPAADLFSPENFYAAGEVRQERTLPV